MFSATGKFNKFLLSIGFLLLAFFVTLPIEKASAQQAIPTTFQKPSNGTLSSDDWNYLLGYSGSSVYSGGVPNGAFVNTRLPALMYGPLGINTVPEGARLRIMAGATDTKLMSLLNNSGTELFTVLNPSGNVGIGTTNPTQKLDVVGSFRLSGSFFASSDGAKSFFVDRYSTNSYSDEFAFRKGRGTELSPLLVSLGDELGGVEFHGYNGSGFTPSAMIRGYVDGTTSAGNVPGRLSFFVNSGTQAGYGTESLTIKSNGNVGIGTTTPSQKLHVNGGAQLDAISFGVTPGQSQDLALATVEYVNNKSGGPGGIGAGTSGQTLRHDGTGWVANSNLFNNGTNVGIGTTAPGSIFHVYGGASASRISIGRAGTPGMIGFIEYPAGVMNMGTAGSDGVNLMTSNTTRFSLGATGGVSVANGNNFSVNSSTLFVNAASSTVGVGTTAPGAKLDVRTNDNTFGFRVVGNMAANDTYNGIKFGYDQGTLSNDYYIGNIQAWKRSGGGGDLILNAASNALTYNSNQLVIAKNNNVGIGTSSPQSKFHIYDGSANLYFDGNEINAVDSTLYLKSLYDFSIQPGGGVTAMTVKSGGFVGIGTTTPSQKLHVNGGAQLDAVSFGVTPGQSQNLALATVEYVNAKVGGVGGIGAGTSGQTLRHDGTAWVANSLLYNNGTNVGIGTTDPFFPLEVIQTDYTGPGIQIRQNRGNTGDAASLGFRMAGVKGANLADIKAIRTNRLIAGDTDLTFSTYTNSALTEKMRIMDNGNVGIGTTAPTAKTEIVGSASNPSLTHNATSILNLNRGESGATEVAFTIMGAAPYTASIQHRHSLSDNISYPLALNPLGGNVGIGTTTPSQKLHVNGGAQLDAVSFGVTPGQSQSLALTTVEYVNAKVGGVGGIGAGTSGQTLRHDGTAWVANSNLFNNGTNVGIGTTNPGYRLSLGNPLNDTSDSKIAIYENIGGGNYFYGLGLSGSGSGAGLAFWGGTETAAPTSTNVHLFIKRNSGNVGIGTTNPTSGYLLDVNGNFTSVGWAFRNNTAINITEGWGLQFSGDATHPVQTPSASMLVGYDATGANYGSSNLLVAGNVGIGTTAPGAKLNVVSTSAGAETFPVMVQNYSATAGTKAGIMFAPSLYNTRYSAIEGIQEDGNNRIGLGFLTSIAGAVTEVMRMNSSGNVGIATTTPIQKLHVNGGAQLDAVSFGVTPGQSQTLALTTVEYVNAKVGGVGGIGAGTSGQTLRHDGTAWVANSNLFNNGTNVGIGQTNPTTKLDVSGTLRNTLATTHSLLGNAGNVVVMADNSGTLYGTSTASFAAANNLDLWRGTKNGNIWNGDSGVGNVGIGLTNPSAKLHLNGNGTTNGIIQRIDSNYITNGQILNLTQASSTFAGTGIFMNFRAGGTGTSTANYLDLRNNNTQLLSINYRGGIQSSYTNSLDNTNLHNISLTNGNSGAGSYYALNINSNAVTVATNGTGGTDELLDNNIEGFKFNSGSTANISGFYIQLKRNAYAPTNNGAYLRARLYTDNGGQPGTLVTTYTSIPVIRLTQAYANYYFAANVALTANTDYWMTLEKRGFAGADQVQVFVNTNPAGGLGWASGDGTSWNVESTKRPVFAVYTRSANGMAANSIFNYGVLGSSIFGNGLRGTSQTGSAINGISVYGYGLDISSGAGINNVVNNPSANAIVNTTTLQRSGTRYFDQGYNTGFIGNAFDVQLGSNVYNTYYLYYNGQTASTTDYSNTARQAGGPAYPLIARSSDYFYFGRNNPTTSYRNLYFDLSNTPNMSGVTWEYGSGVDSNGDCTWTGFTPDYDETNNLTRDGMISPGSFPLTLCKVNNNNQYWMRVSASSVTTGANAYHSTFGFFSGYFTRFYSSNIEKFRIYNNGTTYAAGQIYPGTIDTEDSVQASRYIYDLGSTPFAALGVNTGFYVANNLGVGNTNPQYKLQVTGGSAQLDAVSFGVTPGQSQSLALTTVEYVNAKVGGVGGIGAGTSGQTLRHDGTGWVANSNLFNTGTNVGIGTTAPSTILSVGKSGSTGLTILNAPNGGAAVDAIIFANESYPTSWNNSISSIISGTYQNARLNFNVMNGPSTRATVMSLTGEGNIGIGTTNPSQKLDVQGNLAIGSNMLGGGSTYGYSTGASYATLQMYNGPSGYTLLNNQSYGIKFQTGGNDRVTILNNGNVGIGTTTPSQKLHVNGGAQLDAVSFGVTPGQSQSLALTTVEFVNAKLDNLLPGGASSTWAMAGNNIYNVNSGNVGIGTTAPSQKLDVQGNININENSSYMYDGVPSFKLYKGTDSTYTSTFIGQNAGSTNAFRNTAIGALAGFNNTGSYQLAIGMNAGRSNTGGQQTAFGFQAGYLNSGERQIAIGYGAGESNSTDNSIEIGYQAGYQNSGANLIAIGYQAGYQNTLANQFIVRQSNANSVPLMQGNFATGNLGIGTTTPSQKLHVNGGAQLDAISFGVTPGQSQSLALTTVEFVNAKVDNLLPGGASSTWAMAGNNIYNVNSGNVGIGTTNPGAFKLNVSGDTNITGNLIAANYQTKNFVYSYGTMVLNTNNYLFTLATGGNGDGGNATIKFYESGSGQYREIQVVVKDVGGINTVFIYPLNSSGGAAVNAEVRYMNRASDSKITDFYITRTGGMSYTQFIEVQGSRIFKDLANAESSSLTSVGLDSNLHITSAGNVGIGTNNAGTKLSVAGTSGGSATNLDIATLNNSGGAALQSTSLLFTNTPNSGKASIQSYLMAGGVGADLHFNTSLTSGTLVDRMTILADGNVGIGTTTPSQKLHVNGSAQLDAVSFGVTPGESQTLALTTVEYVNAKVDNLLPGGASSTWAMVGNNIYNVNSGNVGIGTTNPGALLEVSGNILVGTSSTNSLQKIKLISSGLANGDYSGISFSGWNNVAKAAVGIRRTGTYGVGDLAFFLNSTANANDVTISDEKMRITSAGNVGIGTTTPRGKLDVVYAGSNNMYFDSNGTLHISWASSERAAIAQNTSDAGWGLGLPNVGGIRLGGGTLFSYLIGNGTNLLLNPTAGNVGIATTTPIQKLHVNGGAQFDAVSFGVTPGQSQTLALTTVEYVNAKVGGVGGIGAGTSGQTLRHDGTAWVANSLLYNNGTNVGIGNTAPGNKLDVTGSFGVNGIFKGYGSSNGSFFEGKLGVNSLSAGSASLAVFGNAAIGTGYLSSSAPTNGLIVQGNVGIGTSSPAAALHLVGNSQFDGGMTLNGNLNMSASTLIVNKVTANTIDPLYTINGVKYSTFASAISGGVKEEYVGRIKASDFVKQGGDYEAVLDMERIEKGSDLWVWYRVIDFNDDNVEIFLTPKGESASMYADIQEKKIIVRSDKAVNAYIRLVGKRFDWRQWPTRAEDQNQPGGLFVD